MMAYQIIAKDKAGLIMVDVDGEIEWMGTRQQFDHAARLESEYER